MERDFLSLGSKYAPITVKEEASDSSKDSGTCKASGMKWSFANKVTAVPQFMSFKPSQEERPRKLSHDHLVSSGFMNSSTTDAFDSNHKPYYSQIQKSVIPDRQGGQGNHYTMTTYGLQHFDAYPGNHHHHVQEARIFPNSNQTNQSITMSVTTPIHSHFTSSGPNYMNHNGINSQQPLGGVPIMAAPVSILPPSASVVGTTDIRYAAPKPTAAPAQLTIFYAGSVCVYEDVSPEKAQAIMLLAGNGVSATNHSVSTTNCNKTNTIPRADVPTPRSSAPDCYAVSRPHHATPPPQCSVRQSPISSISHIAAQSGSSSRTASELPSARTIGGLSSSTTQIEPPRVRSIGSPAPNSMPAVALPQARKASLARFLEKRKERVITTAPYEKHSSMSSYEKHSSMSPYEKHSSILPYETLGGERNTMVSEGIGSSVNSAGSSPLPAMH